MLVSNPLLPVATAAPATESTWQKFILRVSYEQNNNEFFYDPEFVKWKNTYFPLKSTTSEHGEVVSESEAEYNQHVKFKGNKTEAELNANSEILFEVSFDEAQYPHISVFEQNGKFQLLYRTPSLLEAPKSIANCTQADFDEFKETYETPSEKAVAAAKTSSSSAIAAKPGSSEKEGHAAPEASSHSKASSEDNGPYKVKKQFTFVLDSNGQKLMTELHDLGFPEDKKHQTTDGTTTTVTLTLEETNFLSHDYRIPDMTPKDILVEKAIDDTIDNSNILGEQAEKDVLKAALKTAVKEDPNTAIENSKQLSKGEQPTENTDTILTIINTVQNVEQTEKDALVNKLKAAIRDAYKYKHQLASTDLSYKAPGKDAGHIIAVIDLKDTPQNQSVKLKQEDISNAKKDHKNIAAAILSKTTAASKPKVKTASTFSCLTSCCTTMFARKKTAHNQDAKDFTVFAANTDRNSGSANSDAPHANNGTYVPPTTAETENPIVFGTPVI